MNKTVLSTISSISLALFLVGCGASNSMQKESQPMPKVSKNISKDGKPSWIKNPNINGNKGVVSIVSKKKIKNTKKLYYIAKLKAQAAFETRKGTSINSTSSTKTNKNGKIDYKESVKISSNSTQIAKVIVKETYEDKNDFYMWMVEIK